MIRRILPFLFVLVVGPLPAAADGALIVYSGRAEALVGPLLEQFTARTGIGVRATYQGTPALATQIATEADDSPADLFLAQDSGYLTALADRGLLAPLPEQVLQQVDPRFREEQGRWVGTSGRARVLVYNPHKLSPLELPRSLQDLADPRWKGRIGWAPGNASFQAHVSALRHVWGESQARDWLEAVMQNRPLVYPKNSPQVQAVASGEIDVGWVNHYYLYKLRSQVGDSAANYSFPVPGDAGNVLMTSGVGILASSPRKDQALQLVAFLVSEEAQRYFARSVYEYPTRPGVATHPDVPPLGDLNLANVDPAYLTDLRPTLALLQSLGLQ